MSTTNATASRFDSIPATFVPEVAFGPWLVGLVVDVLLTGIIMTLQHTPLVFLAGSSDIGAEVWHKRQVVFGWGSFKIAALSTPWYASLDGFHTAIITVISQFFFVLRLHSILKRSHWILLVICVCMLIGIGGSLATSIQLFHIDGRAAASRFKKFQSVTISGVISTDIFICATFCWILMKSKTGMARTDSVVERLVLLSWTTALVPVMNDIAKLVAQNGFAPKSSAFIVFSFMQGKLYAISVLVTLCLRQSMRSDNSLMSGAAYNVSGGRRPTGPTTSGLQGVSVTTDEVHFVDYSNGGRTQSDTIANMKTTDYNPSYEMEDQKRSRLHGP
ncbi:hypothetical protein BKA62DRAFT_779741 [Auriculariales sp. MPI-PUGE-AT-0066]|nr:hypothetical protein BKA62DRAFT_779741 [Auriculariales sp. MPI-PUGE-AT-0066]